MGSLNINIVYSAKHTGTWFAAKILASCLRGCGRSDEWVKDVHGVTIEELAFGKRVTSKYIRKVVDEVLRQRGSFSLAEKRLTLQAHHEQKETNLYISLKKMKPEVPVIVPVRNPLLSLNTLLWRQSQDTPLQEIPKEERVQIAKNHARNIVDLLDLPSKNVFFFPIDTPDLLNRENRIKQCVQAAKHCRLKPTEGLYKFAEQWSPVNATLKKGDKSKTDVLFAKIKREINNHNLDCVKRVLGPEFSVFQDSFAPHTKGRKMLKKLGYKNLGWW